MRDPLSLWRRLWKAKSGATAIEYCLIAALIAVLTVTGILSLGSSIGVTFTNIAGVAVATTGP